jgi:hypothetical protein
MEEVNLVTTRRSFQRTIDLLSPAKIYLTLTVFLGVNLVLVLGVLYGPPPTHNELVLFNRDTAVLPSQKFTLKLGKFSFLNDFIAVDLFFVRDESAVESPISASVIAKGHRGRRVETVYAMPLKGIFWAFQGESAVSTKSRLLSRAIVDFTSLDVEIIIKFHVGSPLGGGFIITYGDPPRAILELLMRVLIFFISLSTLVYICSIRAEKTSSPFQIRVLVLLLTLVVFSSNPLIILSYFTESDLLPRFDRCMSLVLILSAGAGTLLIFDSLHEKPELLDANWIQWRLAPFVVAGLFSMVCDLFLTLETPRLLNNMRSMLAAICAIRVMVSLIEMQSEVKLEKIAMAIMVGVTLAVGILCELFCVAEPMIGTGHEIQVYTVASVSLFLLVLARLYWPLDHTKYMQDSDSAADGELQLSIS